MDVVGDGVVWCGVDEEGGAILLKRGASFIYRL